MLWLLCKISRYIIQYLLLKIVKDMVDIKELNRLTREVSGMKKLHVPVDIITMFNESGVSIQFSLFKVQ
jgi:hypothetical protein